MALLSERHSTTSFDRRGESFACFSGGRFVWKDPELSPKAVVSIPPKFLLKEDKHTVQEIVSQFRYAIKELESHLVIFSDQNPEDREVVTARALERLRSADDSRYQSLSNFLGGIIIGGKIFSGDMPSNKICHDGRNILAELILDIAKEKCGDSSDSFVDTYKQLREELLPCVVNMEQKLNELVEGLIKIERGVVQSRMMIGNTLMSSDVTH